MFLSFLLLSKSYKKIAKQWSLDLIRVAEGFEKWGCTEAQGTSFMGNSWQKGHLNLCKFGPKRGEERAISAASYSAVSDWSIKCLKCETFVCRVRM